MAIVWIKVPSLPVHLYLGDQPSKPPPKSPETRAAASRGRLGFGLEQDPPAARDGLRSSRGAATARRDRAAAALGRWGWFGLRDCGFAVCHSARRKVGGREQGRVPGACERDYLWV